MGETVKVKRNVTDEDFGVDLGGRIGRITGYELEDVEEPLYYVSWDSITLKAIDLSTINLHEENQIDWDFTCLNENELEHTTSRDNPEDVESAIAEIQQKMKMRATFASGGMVPTSDCIRRHVRISHENNR